MVAAMAASPAGWSAGGAAGADPMLGGATPIIVPLSLEGIGLPWDCPVGEEACPAGGCPAPGAAGWAGVEAAGEPKLGGAIPSIVPLNPPWGRAPAAAGAAPAGFGPGETGGAADPTAGGATPTMVPLSADRAAAPEG